MADIQRSQLIIIEEKCLQQRNIGKIDAAKLVVDDPQVI